MMLCGGNANKCIRRKVGEKVKILAQECSPGDQENRNEGNNSVCFMPGNRRSQQKLDAAS